MSNDNFLKRGFQNYSEKSNTENEAVTYNTSQSKLLDYFAQGASVRNRNDSEIINMFLDAFNENPSLALKILFYQRDCREGSKEKYGFRIILKWLAENAQESIKDIIKYIPEYSRWDELFLFFNTKLEKTALEIIKQQFEKDWSLYIDPNTNKKEISLLAKWLVTLSNKSTKERRKIALKTMDYLELSPAAYRKRISGLRKHLDIVERKVTEKDYSDIDYSKVPSQAMMKYTKSFFKYDQERFKEYLTNVNSGKSKINTGTLLPYQIVHKVLESYCRVDEDTTKALDTMWNNLPDYITDKNSNGIAVVDVSGSMTISNTSVKPIDISISLGIYLAQRNNGIFKNSFISFSENPQLLSINPDDDIVYTISKIKNSDWGYNTNIEKVFNLILESAKFYNASQQDFPDVVYIISDMEFDACENVPSYGYNVYDKNINKAFSKTVFEELSDKFKDAGYKLPRLVFWNVNSAQDNIPMRSNEDLGLTLVSGSSPETFRAVLDNPCIDPYDFMLSVIDVERYKNIK